MRDQGGAAPDGEAHHGLLVYAAPQSLRRVAVASDSCRRVLDRQPDPGQAAAHGRRGHTAVHDELDGQAGAG